MLHTSVLYHVLDIFRFFIVVYARVGGWVGFRECVCVCVRVHVFVCVVLPCRGGREGGRGVLRA